MVVQERVSVSAHPACARPNSKRGTAGRHHQHKHNPVQQNANDTSSKEMGRRLVCSTCVCCSISPPMHVPLAAGTVHLPASTGGNTTQQTTHKQEPCTHEMVMWMDADQLEQPAAAARGGRPLSCMARAPCPRRLLRNKEHTMYGHHAPAPSCS